MIDRRELMSAAACLAGVTLLTPRPARASTAMTYDEAVRTTYAPLRTDRGLLEAIRYATLAANSHNTQPWKFGLSPGAISIRPDLSRRTPVLDPDEHHLWVSLGCATENLVLAAAALGKHADVAFGPQEVHVALDNASPVHSPLVNAIFQRQCSRVEYGGQQMS